MAEFHCEYCLFQQGAPNHTVGKPARCPRCGQRGVIQENPIRCEIRRLTPEVNREDDFDFTPEVRVRDGGSIRLSTDDVVDSNRHSSLRREWITIVDPLMPAELLGCPGVSVIQRESGPIQNHVKFAVHARKDIRAVEVRFILFGVWGDFSSLLVSQIHDIDAGSSLGVNYSRDIETSHHANPFLTSLAFVSRVRTAEGKIETADLGPIADIARKYVKGFFGTDFGGD